MINVYVDTPQELVDVQAAFDADAPGGLLSASWKIEFRHPQNHPDEAVRSISREEAKHA